MTLDATQGQPAGPAHRPRRDDRLGLRLSMDERALIAEAAAAERTTVTEFVVRSSTEAAHRVLADRRAFVLDAPAWESFTRALDREPRSVDGLVELLREPSVFE